MANPYLPNLVTPGIKGTGDGAAAISFSFLYQHPSAGVSTNAYFMRRRAMTPSVGAYEYWTGAAWGASTANALVVAPGVTAAVSTTGWTNGTVYQWSIQTRDSSNNLSGYATDRLIDVHATPAPTITQPTGAQSYSSPNIVWAWVSAANKRQRSYQLAIYTSIQYGAVDFNASDPAWQAVAPYFMPSEIVSTSEYSHRPKEFVIQPSLTYKAYGKFKDESGLETAWLAGPTFTSAVGLQTPPGGGVTPLPELGVVRIDLNSTGNMLTAAQADFVGGGLGTWIRTLNCELDPETVTTYGGTTGLRITIGGLTFDELTAAQTTMAAMDTAYTTFEAMRVLQAAPAGTSRIQTPAGTAGIAILPSTVYSTLVNVYSPQASKFAKLNVRWYTAAGAASATPISTGSATALPLNTWLTIEREGLTSPADSAFAAIEIEFTSTVVGDIFYDDANSFVRSATVQWVPEVGIETAFVIERQNPDGSWSEIWGASRDNPARPTGSVQEVLIYDRDAPLNAGDLSYRFFTQTGFLPNIALSDPDTDTAAALDCDSWWIRAVDDAQFDQGLTTAKRTFKYKPDIETISAASSADRLFVSGTSPAETSVTFEAWCKDRTSYDNLTAMIRSGRLLVVQTNVQGETFYGYVPEGWSDEQVRAVTGEAGQRVRALYTVGFTLETVSRPER